MADQPGHLWQVIQGWLDSIAFPPSQNKLAIRLGVSGSALGDYKYGRHMPSPEFLEALATEIGVPYETVLDAVLRDAGYRPARIATARRGSGKTTVGLVSDRRLRGGLTSKDLEAAEAQGQKAARKAGPSAGRTARARQDEDSTAPDPIGNETGA